MADEPLTIEMVEEMFAALESSDHGPTQLVCPYCGGDFPLEHYRGCVFGKLAEQLGIIKPKWRSK